MHVLKGSLENSADSMRTRICVPALAVTELESLKLVKTVCSLLTHYYNSTLHLLLHYNLISLLITFVLLAQSENWELNQIFFMPESNFCSKQLNTERYIAFIYSIQTFRNTETK